MDLELLLYQRRDARGGYRYYLGKVAEGVLRSAMAEEPGYLGIGKKTKRRP